MGTWNKIVDWLNTRGWKNLVRNGETNVLNHVHVISINLYSQLTNKPFIYYHLLIYLFYDNAHPGVVFPQYIYIYI